MIIAPTKSRAAILIHKYVYKLLYDVLESEDYTKITQAYAKQAELFEIVKDIEDINAEVFYEVFGDKFFQKPDILIGIYQPALRISLASEPDNKLLFILTKEGKSIHRVFHLSDYYKYKAAVALRNEQMNGL